LSRPCEFWLDLTSFDEVDRDVGRSIGRMRLAPFARRTQSPVAPEASLFAVALGDSSRARLSRRLRVGGLMAAVGVSQGSVLLALLVAVALRPAVREPPNVFASLVFDPAAAAPLPLPKGAPRGSKALRPETSKTSGPEPTQVDIPVEFPIVPAPGPKQTEPEAQRLAEDRLGSETGREGGDPSGMENGIDDGRYGGRLGGSADGIPNGTGAGAVADYDAPPRIVRQTRPLYPPQAFVDKVEGTVVLEILIDVSGHVSRTRVIQSIPPLDTAARDAVVEWVFQPALKRGRPVPSLALAPVHFRLY
jgi:periplasmic protein TonB